MVWVPQDIHLDNKTDAYSACYTKINCRLSKDSNIEGKAINLWKEAWVNKFILLMEMAFVIRTQTHTIKERKDKSNCIKLITCVWEK